MAVGFRWRCPALSRRRLSPACRGPVSPPRSSNRTCGFPASGSPTGFTARHTVDGHVRLVSRDDTVARDQPSPCGRAPAEASGRFVVLPGSSPITGPRLLRKRTRSQGPFLRWHYPASQVVRPCPTAPPVSYQINRQLSGWILPPLVIRAFGAHCPFLARKRSSGHAIGTSAYMRRLLSRWF